MAQKRIKNFNLFYLNEALLESVMFSTSELSGTLYYLQTISSNKIAEYLYTVLCRKNSNDNEVDIKTNYNGIDMSDKNDEISFIPDSQFQKAIQLGKDPWEKTRSKTKIGRLVRQVLNDNGKNFTDKEIEDFVNQFKAAWDKVKGTHRKIEVVTGDKILYWYNMENYYEKTGTLGNSCMRFESKNNFMKLYSSNPSTVSMVVLTENDKLLARALIWKVNTESHGDKIYLDRIYSIYDSDVQFVYNWVKENVENASNMMYYQYDSSKKMKCQLENVIFDEYPYIDSLYYLYKAISDAKPTGQGFISNYKDTSLKDNYAIYLLNDTTGEQGAETHYWSNKYNKFIIMADAVYISSIEDYIFRDEAKLCRTLGSHFLKQDVVFSKSMNDWIPKDRAIESERYGLILESMLIEVISGYIGNSKSPLTRILECGSVDFRDNFSVEKYLEGNDDNFRATSSPCSIKYFDSKYKILDYDEDRQASILCFELFRSNLGRREKEIDEVISNIVPNVVYAGNYYITKIDAEFYGLKIDSSFEPQYVYASNISFERSFYIDYLKHKDSFSKDESVIKEHNTHMEDMHKWAIRKIRNYETNFKMLSVISKIDNIVKFTVDLSNECIKETLEDKFDRVVRFYRNNEGFENTDNVREILRAMGLIYILNGDTYTSRTKLEYYIKTIYPDFYSQLEDASNFFYNIRSLFSEYFDDVFIRVFKGKLQHKIEKDYNHENINSAEFRDYLISNFPIGKFTSQLSLNLK